MGRGFDLGRTLARGRIERHLWNVGSGGKRNRNQRVRRPADGARAVRRFAGLWLEFGGALEQEKWVSSREGSNAWGRGGIRLEDMAAGHGKGFDELHRHAAWARKLARALVGDPAQADDLLQETWLAALRHPPASDRPSRPWLGRVMRNALRQDRRGASRRSARELSRPEPPALPGPDELVQRLETQRALTEELAALEEPYRSTLLLCFFEDLAPAEIARRHGLNAATVRWRLMRALEQLRERLDRRFGPREHWCGLLAAFARMGPPTALVPTPGAPGEPGAATSLPRLGAAAPAAPTGLFTGAWIMHAALKLAGVAAVATVGYFGLSSAGWLPKGLTAGPSEQPLQVSFRPLAPSDLPEEAPRALESAGDPATRRVEAAAAPDSAAVIEDSTARAAFRAVALDERGAPLAGASLTVESGVEASSGTGGRDGVMLVALALDRSAARKIARATIARPGYVSRGTTALVDFEREVHLGNFQLELGGAVSGRVVDAQGQPLSGISVCAEVSTRSRERLERERAEYYPGGAARARSGLDGSFVVHGVPEGLMRVWAFGEGWLASFSPPVEVKVGQETLGVELALEAFPVALLVRGVVLDPKGQPVARASIDFEKRRGGNMTSGSLSADEAGRFRFVLAEKEEQLTLTAHDPAGSLGSARAEGLKAGVLDLRLTLSAAADFELRVVDHLAQPIERFAYALYAADGERMLYDVGLAPRPEGIAKLARLADRFVIEARAPGYGSQRSAVLEQARLASGSPGLTLQLERLGGLRGRVTALGQPVGGAEVSLRALVDDARELEVNGFASLVPLDASDTCRSDEAGEFLLTPRAAAHYMVRAELAGFAPAEAGPLEIDPWRGAGGVELVLGRGGAIEGRVWVDDAPDAGGKIVGISRADGRATTQRVSSDGRFRFERLTPGPWQVRVCENEIGGNGWSSSSRQRGKGPREIEFDCQVREGETTYHDIDLRAVRQCRLSGELHVDGEPAKGWSVRLSPKHSFLGETLDSAVVGLDGGFELSVDKPLGCLLVASEVAGDSARQFLLLEVDLQPGTTRRDLRAKTGALVVRNLGAAQGDVPELVHVAEGADGVIGLSALDPDGEGRCHLARVLCGEGRVVRLDMQSMDPKSWPLVMPAPVRGKGPFEYAVP